ncbi:uncharacterized protein LAJ45_05854 [Morchella importuna]|uniref:uncharacterized protein n=1 Tax=Morchella importuna TaxID=1174673 RepID=UPI001E8C9E5C|nr:uncharacterized protein LAJ45_05854 [Morchella importuna]KAH8150168.1 hypothetical protein LAJ45_05854 [Morchella importuna]
MSYSAVPANYMSDDDQLESPTFQPPKLQLRNFDFGSLSSALGTSEVKGGRSRSGSKVKSSIHSGTSYDMVDSDTESNYDEDENDGNGKGKGKGGMENILNKKAKEHDEISGSGILVSKPYSPYRNNAESMQGGNLNSHGKQQQVHDSMAHGGAGNMHSEITKDPSRLGLQLDGRADSNERGVSAQTSAVPPRLEYEEADNYDDQPRSPRRSRGSSPSIHTPLPPPPELSDHQEYSGSSEDIHPVFRHSQSVPELPPVDVQGLHIHDDRDYRPATSASGVGDLFKDFDGVHFDLDNPEAPGFPLRNQQGYLPPSPAPTHQQYRQSQAYPDHRQSQAYPDHRQSQVYPDPGLVYYPAPVPAMLNLPPTLSKARPNNRNSRFMSTESLGQATNNNRLSVAHPGSSEKDLHRRSVAAMNDPALNNRRSLANLPPALRASQFFDSQLPPIVPDLKEESAVATLDSILDASARAPAAAFTDHPITGGVPSYAHNRNRSTATNLGNYRNSVAINVKLHPGESPRSSLEGADNPDHHNHNPGYDDDDAGSHLNPETGEYYDQQRFSGTSEELAAANLDPSLQPHPTTLLAELESRKAQQRLRNRTAASAFPRGIRSTLLQLDAVTQVQQKHRRTKKTHLAWEEEGGEDEDEKDEDVPLGVLFQVSPGVQKRRDDEIPLGLLMKKEMEDAEPLSKRRDRLRMVNGQPIAQSHSHRMLDVPGLGGSSGGAEEEEVEGETLRERMKRLKEKQQFGTGALDMNFGSDKGGDQQTDKPEVEETLAERRRRLQKEKQDEDKHQALRRESVMLQQEVKSRRNMADLLHAKPMGMAGTRPQSFYGLQGGGGSNGSFGQLPIQPGFTQGGMVGMNMGMGGYGMGGPGLIGRGAGAMGGMGVGPAGMGMMGPVGEIILDPKQREVVERWRASVM